MDISFTVCLFVQFVRLRISPPTIKLAASNFARQFIGVQGRESPIFVNFGLQKPKIGQIHVARALADSSNRDVTFLECRAVCGCRIAMCGYMAVPEDGRTCLVFQYLAKRLATKNVSEIGEVVSFFVEWNV